MKNRFIAIMMLIPAIALAGGSFVAELTSKVTVTNSLTKNNLEGYVESIHIDITGTTTGTVTILTPYETLFTNTVTADTNIRPRFVVTDNTGATQGGGTSCWERVYLDYDSLVFTVVEMAPVTNTTANYKFSVKMVKQQP